MTEERNHPAEMLRAANELIQLRNIMLTTESASDREDIAELVTDALIDMGVAVRDDDGIPYVRIDGAIFALIHVGIEDPS